MAKVIHLLKFSLLKVQVSQRKEFRLIFFVHYFFIEKRVTSQRFGCKNSKLFALIIRKLKLKILILRGKKGFLKQQKETKDLQKSYEYN